MQTCPIYEIKKSTLMGYSGLGFFLGQAESHVAKGATVGYYLGRLMRREDADFQHNCYYMAANPSATLLIDGHDPILNPYMFIQHACSGSGQINVEFREMKQYLPEARAVFVNTHTIMTEAGISPLPALGLVKIRSTKPIRPGEELFANYGKEYYHNSLKGKCLCNAHQQAM